jgi:hypothetical protein
MEGEPFDRRLSRADMLRLAGLAAGVGVVAGPAAAADAAVAHVTKESGRLQVMDWAGYGNDGGQAMFRPTSTSTRTTSRSSHKWRTSRTRSRKSRPAHTRICSGPMSAG